MNYNFEGATFLYYIVALYEGAHPVKLGLSKDKEHAYMHCVDPGEPYTEGGTVIFRLLPNGGVSYR